MAITITGPELAKVSPQLISSLQKALDRLAAADSTLWGPQAETEARTRLGWLSAPQQADSRAFTGLPVRSRTVLCGMGGSSLAPEVIAATYGVELIVLDSTDPGQVQAALTSLPTTIFVVASKSGSTIETDSQRRAIEEALLTSGLEASEHIVVVTDPGSPLDQDAKRKGYRVVHADPNVGGRFSALTAFGLLPSYLVGADIEGLLRDARDATAQMVADPSPAVLLAAAMVRHNEISPYLTIATDHRTPGFGDWVEQLVAESTGKAGKGVLPIVVESAASPDFHGKDRLSISLSPDIPADLVIDAPLGAHFVLWEWATALVGYALGIDPFNQPNVTESKNNTSALLAEWNGAPAISAPLFTEAGIDVYTEMDVSTLQELFDQLAHHAGYLAIMAYLDRHRDREAAQLRPLFGSTLPCTFGWGPRFLHSTGQFHKGGPQIGAFLQITGSYAADLPVPHQPYSFGTLHLAQAIGDYRALSSRGLPIARLHLRERATGIATLLRLAHAG